FYCPAPPTQSVAVGGRVIFAVRVPEERPVVAVEDETDDLRGVNETERFLQQFARCPVSRHDHEEPIDPFPDQTGVRDRDERGRVQQDVVVPAPRLPEELTESRRFQELVLDGLTPASWHDRKIERGTELRHVVERQRRIQNRVHQTWP